jgi:RimJ/RimL family protein N-acetyltransferase
MLNSRQPVDPAVLTDPIALEPAARPLRSGWRFALPVLPGSRVTLREVRPADARALASLVEADDLARAVAPCPPTEEGLARFADWAHGERAAGRLACFAMVPAGCGEPVGLLLLRQVEGSFDTAAWTFVIAAAFRGTGVFQEAAAMAAEFAFEALDARRLEARAPARNGRANGALRKLGAVQEGALRKSLRVGTEFVDQNLWALVREDWRCYREHTGTVHVH